MRHLRNPALLRFLKYALVGGSTFAFDLLLIWIMTEFLGVPYYWSTALGFLIAVSINYFVSRRYVFKGTARRMHHGYLYFILFAGGGALVITGAVALLVSLLAFHYLVARIAVACVVGTGNYLFNLHYNFKVAGYHP
ncbi:MAG TPA: GtrA family protein [Candidatus Paceibacterota bacterium]|nr:GtrA family protein [Candidatus Paceibacterota bacterium]